MADHQEGLTNVDACESMDDSLMQKKEWHLDDWVEMYNKYPSSKAKREPSEQLVKYVKELLPSEPAHVLVPLCGKSPDLRWLYERGNTVVGLEGVETPVREFYEMYPDLQHSVEDLPFGKLFKSSDGRLQVYVCDVTQVPSGALGKFDAVFDWGAYTAIVEGDRQSYVDVVMATMKEDSRYFLEVCHDGPPEATGIPNSVSFRTIKLEFGPSWRLRVLETLDISEDWEVESFFNSYFLITSKNSQ